MFNRLNHIAIICSDDPRSKQFYVEVLGVGILTARTCCNSCKNRFSK